MTLIEWIAIAVAGGVTVAALGLLAWAAIRAITGSRPTSSDADRPVPPDAAGDFQDHMDRLIRLSREIDEHLDRRIGQLHEAIDRAEDLLQKLQARTPATPPPARPTESAGQVDANPPGPGEQADDYVSEIPSEERLAEAARLAARGLDDQEIARRTRLPVGQVRLVRNLGRYPSRSSD